MAGHIHCGDVHDLTPGPWMAVGCCGCCNRKRDKRDESQLGSIIRLGWGNYGDVDSNCTHLWDGPSLKLKRSISHHSFVGRVLALGWWWIVMQIYAYIVGDSKGTVHVRAISFTHWNVADSVSLTGRNAKELVENPKPLMPMLHCRSPNSGPWGSNAQFPQGNTSMTTTTQHRTSGKSCLATWNPLCKKKELSITLMTGNVNARLMNLAWLIGWYHPLGEKQVLITC